MNIIKLCYLLILIVKITFLKCLDNRIFVTSIPKCGTHLLVKCISEITQKTHIWLDNDPSTFKNLPKNCFLVQHLIPSLELLENLKKNNFKTFFISRDPRDQIVSLAFWVQKYPLSFPEFSGILNFNDLIDRLIPISKLWYSQFQEWYNVTEIFITSFEKMVGSRGNGDDMIQKAEIAKIANFLNQHLAASDLEHLITKLFGNNFTFREGLIGSWKKYLNTENKKKIKEELGKFIINLGYEKNNDW